MLSALRSFFLEMTRNPQVQQRAQQELDAVLKRQRLPEFSDQESLPYIMAILKETLRFNPVAPTGMISTMTNCKGENLALTY
jgi:cytochrome P450